MKDSPAQLVPPQESSQRRLKVVYAGNIGAGQGLHRIIPELAQRLGDSVEFHLIGAGSALSTLMRTLEDAGVSNVRISTPMK
ncbi:glycosyltransferase WbuB, partial [Pseudomonas sp. SIMBA_067]